jgi:tetratricopeptide (TPR) repeat protein
VNELVRRSRPTPCIVVPLLLVSLLLAACTPAPPESPEAAPLVQLPALPAIPYNAIESSVREQFRTAEGSLQTTPEDATRNGHLGMLFHAYDWLQEADVCYSRAEVLDVASSRWSYYRAHLAAQGGRLAAATEALERTLSRGGETPAALLLLGDLSLQLDAPEEARQRFARALELHPESPHALLGAARVAARTGAHQEAVFTLQRVLEKNPNFRSAHYQLALSYRALENSAAATRHLEAYQQSPPEPAASDPLLQEVRALRLDSDHLSRQASRLLRKGDAVAALRLYEKILQREPDAAMARYNLALTLQRLDRHDEAVPHYKRFLAAQPASADAHNNLGLAFEALGSEDKARAAFVKAIAVEPVYFPAFLNLGRFSERQGDVDGALDFYSQASALRPERFEPRLARSRILTARGEPRAAVDELIVALEYAPTALPVHEELRRHLSPTPQTVGTQRRLVMFLKKERRFAAAVFALRSLYGTKSEWRDAIALAWLLATCPVVAERRPEEAVELIEAVCAGPAAKDPLALDTLAAAYAAVGRYADARQTAARALTLAQESPKKSHQKRIESIASRLALYREEKAFVEAR